MPRKFAAAIATLALLLGPAWVRPAGSAQETTADADLALGLKQADEGEYGMAVITLDRAARALALQPGRAKDLGQAYLYLGICYVGLGSETVAKARFRDALAQVRDLSLSPEQFPPKVLELFEKARDESRTTAAAAAPAAGAGSPPPVASSPEKRRGSRLPIIIVGAGAAAAGGLALAVGGGESPTTTSAPPAGTETLMGNVGVGAPCPSQSQSQRVVPVRAGTLDVLLSWTDRDRPMMMFLSNIDSTSAAAVVARSEPASNTSARLSTPVQNQAYWIFVTSSPNAPCAAYTLVVTYP